MENSLARPMLAAALVLSTLLFTGCATGATTGADETPTATATSTPTVSEPPSTPVVEKTLTDPEDGTTVTPLAIVTDFPKPAGITEGVHPVLVKVRLEAGDEFDGEVFPYVVSITPRDADLTLVGLGLSNPEGLTPAMKAAGYTPLASVLRGETSTAWIGAWMTDGDTEYDLVYDRAEGQAYLNGTKGEIIPASRLITPLIAAE